MVGAIAAAENLAGINLFVGLAEAYSAAARRRSGRGVTRSGMQCVKGSSPCIAAAALAVAVALVAGSGAAASRTHVWIAARSAVIFACCQRLLARGIGGGSARLQGY